MEQPLPSPLGVKLMRAGAGNGELLAPAPGRVARRVSLEQAAAWQVDVVCFSTGLEDMQGGTEVSPVQGAEWKSVVGGGNPFSRSSLCLCRPGKRRGTLVSLD